MAVLEGLKPEKVFGFFESICQIPHGSENTKALSDWLVAFAKERNLEYYQDELNDVIIIKEASEGYENSEPVIMQGHIDMVCNKVDGCTKDMETEGLDIAIDGVSARSFASQGQTRTAALSIKLAEREIFKDETGEYPVLLLDDVLSELDAGRQEFVLNRIGGGQTLITCCEDGDISRRTGGRVFSVSGGRIREEA